MKKLLIVSLIFILTIALTGCNSLQTQPAEKTTTPTNEKTTETENNTTMEKPMEINESYNLAIYQEAFGDSKVVVSDPYEEGAGFYLVFPQSWGMVSVDKNVLTDSGGDVKTLPQRVSYTFTSQFRPHTHYFTVVISFADQKDDPLVQQQNRVYITEDDKYYYNYSKSTQFCVETGKCNEEDLDDINSEIEEIIDTFGLLELDEKVMEKKKDTKFKSLLYQDPLYDIPFGATEIEGYYTTIEKETSLDGSAPPVTCSGFVITDGPDLLLDNLREEMFGNPPVAILGSENSSFGAINDSTEDNPIRILVTTNARFEGEVIGCMSWPFDSFISYE